MGLVDGMVVELSPDITRQWWTLKQKKSAYIQGVFFNWSYPKNHKYGKKLKYQNWSYPKIHKYGKKLKYQNWSSPKIHKYQNWSPPQKTETRTIVFHSRENPGQQLIRCLTIWKTDCQLSCRL